MPLFEDANVAVVEAAYNKLDTLPVLVAQGSVTLAPTTAGQGVALLKSSRAILVVKPSAGQTCTVAVYGYFGVDAGWVNITELGKEGIAGDTLGDAWKANIGGATRIYVRLTAISGGTVNAWVLRSYV